MDVQLKQVSLEQKAIIEKLLKIYLFELNKINDRDNKKDTGYRYLDLYWIEPERIPYLIYADGKLAGFVLVNEYVVLNENKGAKAIAEFFILSKFRKKELGMKVAFKIFDKFQGKWEIVASKENLVAEKFWDKVIRQYTKGKFSKIILDNDIHKGSVYSFMATIR